MKDWDLELGAIEAVTRNFPDPSVNEIESSFSTPWGVLVSTIISLRTKDAVTLKASIKLLTEARDPQALLDIGEERVADLIYPAGFYHTKASNLVRISQILIEQYNGVVPGNREALLAFPGVGLKTANLVLGIGFRIPAICVDIHVHRIANRRGWLVSDKPDLTERLLREILPEKWWIDINKILVSFGQRVCTPLSPHCSTCLVSGDCPREGVDRTR
jgi:endonuclease-3